MNQAADITRLGMFSAHALPIVLLCPKWILPERIQPYEVRRAAHLKHRLRVIIARSNVSLIDYSNNVVLGTEARLVHGCVVES